MLRSARLLPAAALALVATACAPGASVKSGPEGPATSEARVAVTNHNWSDVNVYLERTGMRLRLGTVTSMANRAFTIPRSFMNANGDVRLVADPIGSRDLHVTHPLQIWPGQTVDFKIENHMAISSVSVWD